jgi:hypothetical protein
MNVFVLTTGRTGSTTLTKACSFIENYSSAHESRCDKIGEERLNYPENHIEIDNRLSFYLGSLDKKYGDNAVYVHLIRNEMDVANSYNKRWYFKYHSIMRAFTNYIKYLNCETLSPEQLIELSIEYVNITNDNIRLFLKDKTKTCQIRMENFHEDFKTFWNLINANGNLESALEELTIKHNASFEESIEFKEKSHEKKKDSRIKVFMKRIIPIF